MPPNEHPFLGSWSVEAIVLLFTSIGVSVGGGVAWLITRGLPVVRTQQIKWGEWQLKKKERLAKIRQFVPEDAKEALWEDKNLAAGYKALFMAWDARMKVLENELVIRDQRAVLKDQETQALHTAYLDCLENHAKERERATRFEERSATCEDRISYLEALCNRFKERLKINGIDPNPSPIHLPPKLPPPDGSA